MVIFSSSAHPRQILKAVNTSNVRPVNSSSINTKSHLSSTDAAKIDDVLSLDERTSWMEFDGSISGESKGHYQQKCDKEGKHGSSGKKPANVKGAAPKKHGPTSSKKAAPKPTSKKSPGKKGGKK